MPGSPGSGRAAVASETLTSAVLPIRSWPEHERPRERLLRHGATALGDAELVAVLIGTGRRGETALEVARRVVALCGEPGLPGLSRCAAEDLRVVKGMGAAKAAALLAALELGRRVGRAGVPARVNSTAEAVAWLDDIRTLDHEQFRVLLLNTKHRVLAGEVVGVGGLDQVEVHPREVFKPAIRRSAAAVILAHNHPSGDPEPSPADVSLTQRLLASGRVLGIGVLDHLVFGRAGHVSMRDRGMFRFDD